MIELVYRYCSTCAGESAFEMPVCADGHGADCPELVCVECGTALLVGVLGEVDVEDEAAGSMFAAASTAA